MVLTLLATFTGVGLLLIALAVPLMRRSVPPNDWYGLRVAATFADESVWYEANARSGRDLLIVGVLQIVVAVVTALLGVPEIVYAMTNIAALLIGTVTLAVVGIRRAERIFATRDRSGSTRT